MARFTEIIPKEEFDTDIIIEELAELLTEFKHINKNPETVLYEYVNNNVDRFGFSGITHTVLCDPTQSDLVIFRDGEDQAILFRSEYGIRENSRSYTLRSVVNIYSGMDNDEAFSFVRKLLNDERGKIIIQSAENYRKDRKEILYTLQAVLKREYYCKEEIVQTFKKLKGQPKKRIKSERREKSVPYKREVSKEELLERKKVLDNMKEYWNLCLDELCLKTVCEIAEQHDYKVSEGLIFDIIESFGDEYLAELSTLVEAQLRLELKPIKEALLEDCCSLEFGQGELLSGNYYLYKLTTEDLLGQKMWADEFDRKQTNYIIERCNPEIYIIVRWRHASIYLIMFNSFRNAINCNIVNLYPHEPEEEQIKEAINDLLNNHKNQRASWIEMAIYEIYEDVYEVDFEHIVY